MNKLQTNKQNQTMNNGMNMRIKNELQFGLWAKVPKLDSQNTGYSWNGRS